MVYLHFPSNLTEEELMLQAKFAKLRKKKKALQALKSPRPEPERTPQLPKRPAEARDAREVAKKLIKSGAITAITKAPKRIEQAGFKRPRGLERKLSGAERTVSGYQPFSATHLEDVEDSRPKVKNLYESFVSARDREERGLNEKRDGRPDKPRQGNTIFVSGYKITEDSLKKAFDSCGNIVNVTVEVEKNRGFVTFDKVEAAERAISEMDGSMASGVPLKVSLARRQPVIQPINDASSSSTWSTIAASHSQKGATRTNGAWLCMTTSFLMTMQVMLVPILSDSFVPVHFQPLCFIVFNWSEETGMNHDILTVSCMTVFLVRGTRCARETYLFERSIKKKYFSYCFKIFFI